MPGSYGLSPFFVGLDSLFDSWTFLFQFPFLAWPCATGPYCPYNTFFGNTYYDTLSRDP
jgi:hypothetical protein